MNLSLPASLRSAEKHAEVVLWLCYLWISASAVRECLCGKLRNSEAASLREET